MGKRQGYALVRAFGRGKQGVVVGERHEVELLGKEALCADVVSLRFRRPEGFVFRAGQWMIMSVPTPAGPLSETFTISSAPGDDHLEITTRMSGSAFKLGLEALGVGETVGISGPGGRLVLPADLRRVAFLVGGVGITPARSMLRDIAQHGGRFDDALLFYGNRDESCVPFGEELASLDAIGVRLVLCIEQPSAGWSGESGFITAKMVRGHLDPFADERSFVVAGPPVMVEAMESVLDDLEIPASRRMVERFGSLR